MKRISLILACVSVSLILIISCKKDGQTGTDYTAVNNEINNTKTDLSLSKSYNDTLTMVYDTAKVHKNNTECIKYDKLYHKSDSMFTVHYTMFGDEMYKDGIMMKGYTPGSMMGGGMMNTGMMDMHQIQGDTAMMNGYYNSMQQLRTKHQVLDQGIYN